LERHGGGDFGARVRAAADQITEAIVGTAR